MTDRTKPPPGWETIKPTDSRGVTYGRESYWREPLECAWEVYDEENAAAIEAARREGIAEGLRMAIEVVEECPYSPGELAELRKLRGEHVGAAKGDEAKAVSFPALPVSADDEAIVDDLMREAAKERG